MDNGRDKRTDGRRTTREHRCSPPSVVDRGMKSNMSKGRAIFRRIPSGSGSDLIWNSAILTVAAPQSWRSLIATSLIKARQLWRKCCWSVTGRKLSTGARGDRAAGGPHKIDQLRIQRKPTHRSDPETTQQG